MKITIKPILLLFIIAINCHWLCAQCSQNTYSFNTQEEVDNFPAFHPTCTEITGNLIIQNSEAYNLDSLIQITKVANRISIRGNSLLGNLSGLSNIVQCSDLEITNNSNLTNANGIANIQELYGTVIFVNNPRIQTFIGLNLPSSINKVLVSDNDSMFYFSAFKDALDINDFIIINDNPKLGSLEICETTKRIGNLTIQNHPSLVQISSLDSLIAVDTLSVINNNRLTLLPHLDQLQNVNGQLIISDNDTLKTINRLPNLIAVENGLLIHNNRNLEDFTGTIQLNSIGNKVEFINNLELDNIDGLSTANHVSTDSLSIVDNLSLVYCQNDFVCDYIRDENKYREITNNGSNSCTAPELLDWCVVDTKESESLTPFSIYPIPFVDELHISAEDNAKWQKIELFNSTGKLILENQNDSSILSTRDLSSGYYYLHLHANDEIYSFRLVK